VKRPKVLVTLRTSIPIVLNRLPERAIVLRRQRA
jgi:hypothetical protein